MPNMSALVLLLFSQTAVIPEGSQWPTEELCGVWTVSKVSAKDGLAIAQAKDNLLILHNDGMIIAIDRNYAPPNPAVTAAGFKFSAVKTTGDKTLGLVRMGNAKFKFILTRREEDGTEKLEIIIQEYAEERLIAISATRTDLKKAKKRVQELLSNPDYKSSSATPDLKAWLQEISKTGEPSDETKSPS